MKYQITVLLVSLSILLTACSDDDKAGSESSSSAISGAEQDAQTQDDRLSDEQVKTLRHSSQALLRARLEQKNKLQADIATDRELLNTLQDIVGELERELNSEQMQVVLNSVVSSDSTVSGLEINSSSTMSYRYQPATQTFVEVEGGHNNSALPASSGPVNQSANNSKAKAIAPAGLQETISNARASLTAIRQTLNAEQNSHKPSMLTQLQTSLGFTGRKPQAVSDADRNTLLLKFADDAEAVVQAIEADQTAVLPQLRQLKQKLSLQIPGTTLPEAEPTIVSLTEHRHK